MADEQQLRILKDGVKAWNKWRQENPDIKVDFEDANLKDFDLQEVKLWKANLRFTDLTGTNLLKADFREAKLLGAKFTKAILVEADLSDSDLRTAHLEMADLRRTNLVRTRFAGARINHANLSGANLFLANLGGASLVEVDLKQSDLKNVNLSRSDLRGADLTGARFDDTDLGYIDFSETKGLDEVKHYGPSPISTSTLELSKGKIPEKFLRGCGLSDWEIESAKLYRPGLSSKEIDDILYRLHDLRVGQALQINPLFISYSHKDSTFVDAMEEKLDAKGIRFWRDIHHATAGRLEKVVDRAMRQNPTVLLVLSENSVQSDWVEHEARSARQLEKELKRDVLCPVALDGAWKDCAWPARLREQIMEYNILDFSNWKDESEFTKKFTKLVEGLDLFYKE